MGCCAAAMPITMSATCHLNNIKLIAENLPPSSSIEWLRNMGVVWPIFQGGQLQEAIGFRCMFSTICHCLPGHPTHVLKGGLPAAYAPGYNALLSLSQCFVWFVNSWSALVVAIVDTFKCRLLLSAASRAGVATCT